MAFTEAGCVDSPIELSDFAAKDNSRIVGTIAKALAANSPWINVLGGGTFPSGVSDEVRSVVQMPAAPGDSLAEPTFEDDLSMCGKNGSTDLTDTTEFAYKLESKRGTGPRVCVKKGYAAFKDAYTRAEQSLGDLVTQYINADVRAQMLRRSASKFVSATGYSFKDLFTGGTETDIGQPFVDITPNAQLSFKSVHRIARHLREILLADTFGSGAQAHFRLIGGTELIESFREESGVKDVLTSLTQGSYKLGESVLTAYSWDANVGYRGIAFASEQRPLRASGFVDGVPTLVNPLVNVVNATKNTARGAINPAWESAPYEFAFLLARGSFERLVPERYVGEGSFRFAPQLYMGELQWHYVQDNDCNTWGDFGWHKYQITRAYKPVRPQWIVPIAFKRCEADLGLTTCSAPADAYTGTIL